VCCQGPKAITASSRLSPIGTEGQIVSALSMPKRIVARADRANTQFRELKNIDVFGRSVITLPEASAIAVTSLAMFPFITFAV
jgi:predicted HTH domain antitoxin